MGRPFLLPSACEAQRYRAAASSGARRGERCGETEAGCLFSLSRHAHVLFVLRRGEAGKDVQYTFERSSTRLHARDSRGVREEIFSHHPFSYMTHVSRGVHLGDVGRH